MDFADSMAAGEPIVEMAAHGREALLASRDGAIHAYDMERELFKDVRIPEFAGLSGTINSRCSPHHARMRTTALGRTLCSP